jgi:hypothetical protein
MTDGPKPDETFTGDLQPYYAALGEFIAKFAMTEQLMQLLLREVANVEDSVAKSIFSGTRVEAATQYIRRITEAQNVSEEKTKGLFRAFDQLSIIRIVRNDLIHIGAGDFDENWNSVVSNALVAHAERTVRETAISPKIIASLIRDLELISNHLLIYGRRED